MIYGRKGAMTLALWTSFLFSALYTIGPQMVGQNTFFAIALNNIAFFSVAYLSGLLSEQFIEMGAELETKEEDIKVLKGINELIVENITTGLLTMDEGGRIQYINQVGLEILGAESAEQRTLADINKQLALKVGNYKENTDGKTLNRVEVELKADDHTQGQNIEVIISPLFGRDETFQGHVLLLQDQTERKSMEYQMRQQEKLAAVGQLAAGIAHEIRNPLASISGSIQLMVDSDAIKSTQDKRLMGICLKEIDRLNKLISEFLEFVRPEIKAEDPVSVNELMSEVLDMVKFNSKVRSDIKQVSEMGAKKIILGHRDKLKQAFLNIVLNAYQAMHDTAEAEIFIQTYDESDRLILVIRDNGQGMTKENKKRIFEPFHTTKTNGTGLGLAITHKILESHRARVTVDSEVGKGTSFIMEFPIEELLHPNDMAVKKHA